MLWMFLFLYFVVQLSFHGSEGDYKVLVSVHSLVLLELRCAECYDAGGGEVQRNSCCDENNTNSCPNSCDIVLRFCQLGDLSRFNLADRLFGIECPGTPLSNHFEDFLGYNLNANETYSDKESLQGGVVFNSRVVYDGAGRWKGAQLNISNIDRDPGDDIDDLIDYFSIPINISAGSSMTSNFTGIYNYTQLELTIEVTCTAQNNVDESCACVPGFTGQLCDIINCTAGVPCKNGGSCVAGSCSCSPGYTGARCELEVPGMEMTTSSSTSSQGPPEAAAVPVAAIAGGVVGGLAAAFLLIIIALLLLFIIKSRTEAHIVLAARNAQDSDYHDYDEADYDTVIETKECATYAIQKKADLESNPAYIIYAEVGGDEVATVEMRECAAYGTQEAVATKDLEANPAYQAVTTGYEMKECPAYGTQERVVTDVNPAYQTVTAYS